LITIDEQDQVEADDPPVSDGRHMSDLVVVLWQRRRWLAIVTGFGLLLAIGYSFLIPNEYQSTAQLMPPDSQSLSNTSVLSAISGGGLIVPGVGGGLLNQRTPGATSMAILSSRTAQDDIINRFDLRQVYHCRLYVDARKKLTKQTILLEDKKSGIITITVMDRDRNRAREIAEAYIEELDKLVNSLSTSSARRERIFLEERIKSIKDGLDSSSRTLSQFSSRNATFDPQKQGEAAVELAGKLQSELIAAQSELSGLKAMYTDDNMRVRLARGRIDELQRQLRKMGGLGENVDGADLKSDQLLPSVRKLPVLGFTYYDLYRQVTMQETLYEALSKQYELAKVQEAKEIPPIKVLDAPELAERKSLPHRSIIVAVGALLSCLGGIAWILGCELWKTAEGSHPVKAFGVELLQSIRRNKPASSN
jgi:uncharacterized protein involved in exopolysaccharide biosynthesis